MTNIVKRPTKTASSIKVEELKEGALELESLISEFKPKLVVFNGIMVYRTFLQYVLKLPKEIHKGKIEYGRQPDYFGDVVLFAMPSSSPRSVGAYPAARHKVPFYQAIKKIHEDLQD